MGAISPDSCEMILAVLSTMSLWTRVEGGVRLALVCAAFLSAGASAQQELIMPPVGEQKLWHKITIDFHGPLTAEFASPNPFTDYRLNVTFTHVASGRTMLVPGYYAADGNAANSSAEGGDVWRVHFAPDATGEWIYAASFRTGPNVAMNPDVVAGEGAGFFDGGIGSINIAPTDKNGRDMRARGRLEYVGKHHLRFAGTGRYFMKAGTDSPENLLSYADFDGGFKTDGKDDSKVKTWAPHIQDWREGDPEWQGGKGKGLIGAINYLASEGLNSFSFLTMNIDGDDKNVFPYLSYEERLRLDVSRMDQWGLVFDHGTKMGMHLHFKTQETENELMLDGGDMGDQRRLYYRELIARFAHNLALNWNLGEEINDASLAQKVAWAQFFHDNDPYHHPIVIHNGASHFDMMGDVSKLTGFSLQLNESNFSDTFYQTRRYVKRSVDFGKPWVVASDEPGDSRLSVRPDNDAGASHRDARRDALWANIMAGGAGCEFYFGYDKPEGDLTLQNFRSRDAFWDYCRHAIRFFNENTVHFEQMSNHNELVSGSGDNANRCLAKIGSGYLVQLRDGGSATLDLVGTGGTFVVKWFNPRTGEALFDGGSVEGGGSATLGPPPNTPTEDWIVLVLSTEEGGNAINQAPEVDAGPDKSAFLRDGSALVSLNGAASDDGLPDEFLLARSWSLVSGPGSVSFSSPSTASTKATFTEAGPYLLRFFASDSVLETSDEVEILIRLPETGTEHSFVATQDAYTQNGLSHNGTELFVENSEEACISYLKFEVPDLKGEVSRAILRLTQGADISSGVMILKLFQVASNEWTESSLSEENAPTKIAECASFTGNIGNGATVEFDVTSLVTGAGVYSLILEAAPSTKDVSFSSRESETETVRPMLVVTTGANHSPIFSGFALTTRVNVALVIPAAEILNHASDPDGDPLSIDLVEGSTTAGGQVGYWPEGIVYTPSIDFSGPDSFLLTVQDDRGGFATAQLSIMVTTSDGIGGKVPVLEMLPEGGTRIRFVGGPGFGYLIQRSSDLIDWATIETVPALAPDELDYIDTTALEPPVFYRVTTP